VRREADQLLQAFARSDLDTIERLCAEDVLLWGTDEGELWEGLEQVLASFAGAFDLQVRWLHEPVENPNWVAGLVEFTVPGGTPIPVRVTMVFRDGLLAHAHYSVTAAA
jgi:hypothetical protein